MSKQKETKESVRGQKVEGVSRMAEKVKNIGLTIEGLRMSEISLMAEGENVEKVC